MNWSNYGLSRRAPLGAALLFAFAFLPATQTVGQSGPVAEQVPQYKVDPSWPKPLPHKWALGPVCGVSVDSHGNIWIVQRGFDPTPATGTGQSGEAPKTRVPAPPVLEFAPDGTLISSWGGPEQGYDWPKEVHGIYVDRHDNVWLGGAAIDDNQILKFTSRGKFELQIGHAGQNRGSNDTENLGGPASMVVDETANELYVADGYVNHRVIVFDASTGAYKRHWGAYGKRPDDSYYTKLGMKPGQHTTNTSEEVPDAAPQPQFDLVHGLRISADGLVYVCDRSHNRIQIFRKDGTFLREAFVANDVLASGSTSDIGFSQDPQQRFAFVADSTKQHVYILDRKSLKILSTFGQEGKLAGQLDVAHNLAVGPKGDLFVTESEGSRIQRFIQGGSNKADNGETRGPR